MVHLSPLSPAHTAPGVAGQLVQPPEDGALLLGTMLRVQSFQFTGTMSHRTLCVCQHIPGRSQWMMNAPVSELRRVWVFFSFPFFSFPFPHELHHLAVSWLHSFDSCGYKPFPIVVSLLPPQPLCGQSRIFMTDCPGEAGWLPATFHSRVAHFPPPEGWNILWFWLAFSPDAHQLKHMHHHVISKVVSAQLIVTEALFRYHV